MFAILSPRRKSPVQALILAVLLTAPVSAAEYSFGVMMRAGGTGWEVSLGPDSGSQNATRDLTNYWLDDANQRFEIEYRADLQQARVRIYRDANSSSPNEQVTWNVAGATPTGPRVNWTIPAASFYVLAQPDLWFTGVTVTNLTLSGGVNVLSPIASTTMTSSQWLFGSEPETQPSAVTFYTTAAQGGSWMLSGNISWQGLAAHNGGWDGFFAAGNDLEFGFLALASDAVPEPCTIGMFGIGLALLAMAGRRRRAR